MKRNVMVNKIVMSCVSCILATQAFAVMDDKDIKTKGEYTQILHVVNLLANTGLADAGMTETPVIVKYYNGGANPCWTTTLNFRQDTVVHAGPGLGCDNKINQVIVMPSLVADKLKTYHGPASIEVDTTKYSTHLTMIQDQAPLFDNQNGLVASSGSIRIQRTTD